MKPDIARELGLNADKNGLCSWDDSDHSGMDNQVSRLGYIGRMEFVGVDLNCYLVRERVKK